MGKRKGATTIYESLLKSITLLLKSYIYRSFVHTYIKKLLIYLGIVIQLHEN